MKLAVFGKTPESKRALKQTIKEHGSTYSEKNPDVVISFGGDGTFLLAEQQYPGIPKALARYSEHCIKCNNLAIENALQKIANGRYRVTEYDKLKATIGKRVLHAVNDIVVRNIDPLRAIRFTLAVNGKKRPQPYIGDGIVAATPFGSTGYYYSITRQTFSKGIGIAFNNTTTEEKPLRLKQDTRVELTLTRHDAHVAADNNPRLLRLREGNSVIIQASDEKARIISF